MFFLNTVLSEEEKPGQNVRTL